MASDSILLDKSLKFAARIVKLHKYLIKEKHENIISALEKGNFYASTGPEIKALYMENGKICVDCSDAKNVLLYTGQSHFLLSLSERQHSHNQLPRVSQLEAMYSCQTP